MDKESSEDENLTAPPKKKKMLRNKRRAISTNESDSENKSDGEEDVEVVEEEEGTLSNNYNENEEENEGENNSISKPKTRSPIVTRGKTRAMKPFKGSKVCCVAGCTEQGVYDSNLLDTDIKFKSGMVEGLLCTKHYFEYVKQCKCCIYKCRFMAFGEPWSRLDKTLSKNKLAAILKKNTLRNEIRHDQLCIHHYRRFFGPEPTDDKKPAGGRTPSPRQASSTATRTHKYSTRFSHDLIDEYNMSSDSDDTKSPSDDDMSEDDINDEDGANKDEDEEDNANKGDDDGENEILPNGRLSLEKRGTHTMNDKESEDLKKALRKVSTKLSKLKDKLKRNGGMLGDISDDDDSDDEEAEDSQTNDIPEDKHCWEKECTLHAVSTLKHFAPFEVYTCAEHKRLSEDSFIQNFCYDERNVCSLCGRKVRAAKDIIVCAECGFAFCRGCIQRFSADTSFFNALDDENEPFHLIPFDRLKVHEQDWVCMVCERCEEIDPHGERKRKAWLAALKDECKKVGKVKREELGEETADKTGGESGCYAEEYTFMEPSMNVVGPRPALSLQRIKNYGNRLNPRGDDFVSGGNFLRRYCDAIMDVVGAMNRIILDDPGSKDTSKVSAAYDAAKQLSKVSFGSHWGEQEVFGNSFSRVASLLLRYNFYAKLIADTPSVFKTNPFVLSMFLKTSSKIRKYMQKIEFITGKRSAFAKEVLASSNAAREKAQRGIKDAEKSFSDILSNNAQALSGMVAMNKSDGIGEKSGTSANDELLNAHKSTLRSLKKDKKKKDSEISQQKALIEETRHKYEKIKVYQIKEEQNLFKDVETHQQMYRDRKNTITVLSNLRSALSQFSDLQDTYLSQARVGVSAEDNPLAGPTQAMYLNQYPYQAAPSTADAEQSERPHRPKKYNTSKAPKPEHNVVAIFDRQVIISKFPGEHLNHLEKRLAVTAVINTFKSQNAIDIVDDVKEVNTAVIEAVHTLPYIQSLVTKANYSQQLPDVVMLSHTGEAEPFIVRTSDPAKMSENDKRMCIMPELSVNALRVDIFSASAVCCAIDLFRKKSYSAAFCLTRSSGHNVGPAGPAAGTVMQGPGLINSVAIGVKYLRLMQPKARIAVVDIDAIHGSGTQEALAGVENVTVYSIHAYSNTASLYLPGTGGQDDLRAPLNVVNVPIKVGSDGNIWLDQIATKIVPKLETFSPDVMIISFGLNGLSSDPMRLLELTPSDYAKATRAILDVARKIPGCKVASVLESAYSPIVDIQTCITDHIKELIEFGNDFEANDYGTTSKRSRGRKQHNRGGGADLAAATTVTMRGPAQVPTPGSAKPAAAQVPAQLTNGTETGDQGTQGKPGAGDKGSQSQQVTLPFQTSTPTTLAAANLPITTFTSPSSVLTTTTTTTTTTPSTSVATTTQQQQQHQQPILQKPSQVQGSKIEQTLMLQKHQQVIQEKQIQRQQLFKKYQEIYIQKSSLMKEGDTGLPPIQGISPENLLTTTSNPTFSMSFTNEYGDNNYSVLNESDSESSDNNK